MVHARARYQAFSKSEYRLQDVPTHDDHELAGLREAKQAVPWASPDPNKVTAASLKRSATIAMKVRMNCTKMHHREDNYVVDRVQLHHRISRAPSPSFSRPHPRRLPLQLAGSLFCSRSRVLAPSPAY